jgi:hypothetical protein
MPVLINLKQSGYHLVVLTNQLLLFCQIKKNHNQNYKTIIDFLSFLKNQKIYCLWLFFFSAIFYQKANF